MTPTAPATLAATQTAAPTITSFSTDSGVVGDHITNDKTLTLTGTTTANTTVNVFDGSTQLGTATADANGGWSFTTVSLADGSHALTASTTTVSTPGVSPLIFEDFNSWSGNVSPDGIWRIAGTWQGTGNNTLQPSNVSFTNTYPGETDTGFMTLTVPAGSPLRGAELQSLTTPGYSYGYYETRLMTTNVKNGGVVSFFWIEQPNYGSHEWDIEFTLSDSWAGTSNPGRVSFTTHPLDNTQWVNLGFNPSQTFHKYGFLWTPGRIDFTVDGQVVRTVTDPALKTDATGYIMMNTWSSGNPNFGGGPPTQAATSVYDWVKFYPGATSIPTDGGSTGGTSGSSTPLSIRVDTKPPSAPTIAASTPTSTHVEVLKGAAEAHSRVTVFDGATKIGSATTNSSGAWSYTTAPLSAGNHSFTATATDAAGNTGAASSAAVVTIATANSINGTSGADSLTGDGSNNTIIGYAGNDILNGKAGNDTMIGGTGNDRYVVDSTRDIIDERGASGTDLVQSSVTYSLANASRVFGSVEKLTLTGTRAINGTGNTLANIITGNGAANVLHGGLGGDKLVGMLGKDTLVGGKGNDVFVFNTKLSSANIDKITDFHNLNGDNDSFRLENAVFTKLGPAGHMKAGFFYAGTSAHDANDHIIYNKATGALFYDTDGLGGGAQVQIATLTNKVALAAADFTVV
jgi:Ca2+-binding RTX toxin-like protein